MLYSEELENSEKLFHKFEKLNNIVVVDKEVLCGENYLNEIKDSLIAGFSSVLEGKVSDFLRFKNLKISLLSLTLHSDSIHRGAGQMIPTARRALLNALEVALMKLMIPIFELKMILTKNEILDFKEFLKTNENVFSIKNLEIGDNKVILRGYLETIVSKISIFNFLEICEKFGFIMTKEDEDELTTKDKKQSKLDIDIEDRLFDVEFVEYTVEFSDPNEQGSLAYNFINPSY